jgi:hypothetical protein
MANDLWRHIFLSDYSVAIVRLIQIAGGLVSLLVWWKLRRIEKKYLFVARSKDTKNQIAQSSKLIFECVKSTDFSNAQNYYHALVSSETTLKRVLKISPKEVSLEISKCDEVILRFYSKSFVPFRRGTLLPFDQQRKNDLWELQARMSSLETLINNLSKDQVWRS